MHVHWLYMSPGPYFRPLILSFPLPGAGAHENRRKLGLKDLLGLWPQRCFLLERKAQLGPCGFSFFESPVLTSTAPISGLHHPHTALRSPQDVLQGTQTAHIQAHHGPFSPDPPFPSLPPRWPGEASASTAPSHSSTFRWSLNPADNRAQIHLSAVSTSCLPAGGLASAQPLSAAVLRPSWSQQLPTLTWLLWSLAWSPLTKKGPSILSTLPHGHLCLESTNRTGTCPDLPTAASNDRSEILLHPERMTCRCLFAPAHLGWLPEASPLFPSCPQWSRQAA